MIVLYRCGVGAGTLTYEPNGLAFFSRGGGWGVPMSHVDYKKWCRPVEFKKLPCRPVEFKKHPCRPVEFKKLPCRMSLRPKKGHVALSILGVHTHLVAPVVATI